MWFGVTRWGGSLLYPNNAISSATHSSSNLPFFGPKRSQNFGYHNALQWKMGQRPCCCNEFLPFDKIPWLRNNLVRFITLIQMVRS